MATAARALLGQPPARALDAHGTYAMAESPEDAFAPSRYWLRSEPASGHLLLVGYFGFTHTILCDLMRHPR